MINSRCCLLCGEDEDDDGIGGADVDVKSCCSKQSNIHNLMTTVFKRKTIKCIALAVRGNEMKKKKKKVGCILLCPTSTPCLRQRNRGEAAAAATAAAEDDEECWL